MRLIYPSYTIDPTTDWDQILKSIELAARVCYKTEDKIGPGTAEKMVTMLRKKGHMPVLNHATLRVHFIVDRGVSHELVRHRIGIAICQESTRYVSYKGGATFIIPPWVDISAGEYTEFDNDYLRTLSAADRSWYQMCFLSEQTYLNLLAIGWQPQQARSILVHSVKTELVVTADITEWLHIFSQRTSPLAHPQMREVMCPLYATLKTLCPSIFGDLE